MRARHRPSTLLLRHGIVYSGGKAWTGAHDAWLLGQHFSRVGTQAAFEIGDWDRFTGGSIGAYLGLVPSEPSSGSSRSHGAITKTGNTHVRRLLVEAAWHRLGWSQAAPRPARLTPAATLTTTGPPPHPAVLPAAG